MAHISAAMSAQPISKLTGSTAVSLSTKPESAGLLSLHASTKAEPLQPSGAPKLTAWPKRLLLVAWYGLTLASYAHFAPSIDHHDAARRDTQQALAAMQLTIDHSPPGRDVYIPNHAFKPFLFFPTLFPGWAAVFVVFHPDNRTGDGRPIHFVEDNPGVIEALQRGKRTEGLLATREQAAAAAAAK